MGGISVGGGHGGKKALDSDIPLVPFIDLLLCCVMFLLVSAVWTQLAGLNANQQAPGQPSTPTDPPPPSVKLILQVQAGGYVLATTAGERSEIPKVSGAYDRSALQQRLHDRRQLEPNRHDITVAPEDGVVYSDVISAMDTALGEGYASLDLSDGATL